MQIARIAKIATGALVLTFAVSVAVANYTLSHFAVGSGAYNSISDGKDLIADTVPPPLTLLEGQVVTGQALTGHISGDRLKAKFAELRKAYDASYARWQSEQLDPAVRQILDGGVHALSLQYFAAVEQRFMPALSAGDRAALDQSYADLNGLYLKIMEKVGELVAIVAKSTGEMEQATLASQHLMTWAVWLSTALMGLIIAMMSWGMHAGLLRPLHGINSAMAKLAEGDLDISLPGLGRSDEIGCLAKDVEHFKQSMAEKVARDAAEQAARVEAEAARRKAEAAALSDNFERAVGSVVSSFAAAVSQLKGASETLVSGTAETTAQSASVASTSSTASANVESVAAATEQLSYSIREISDQVHRSHAIASGAATDAEKTNAQMRALAEAAERIGGIVDVISQIASQTNMLALNATIEAARAGDAGRGFAVVAQEVKALAEQTAKATTDIGTQIAGIQETTAATASFIQSIVKTTNEVSGIASTIASAVEQQGSATKEIARNIQEASRRTKEVNSNIDRISTVANLSGRAASEVADTAAMLGRQSDVLRRECDQFLRNVRAA